jgi:ABC-type lipoprotein export system ATPase subunit
MRPKIQLDMRLSQLIEPPPQTRSVFAAHGLGKDDGSVMTDLTLLQWSLTRLLAEHPYARDFFSACDVPDMDQRQTVVDFLRALPPDRLHTLNLDQTTIVDRLSGEQRLVAQLSQNMNFVMDLSVQEFLALHAESRLVGDVDGMVRQIVDTAVSLAGEPFDGHTPVTALSGGQSRALMIADMACLSASPIVVIDEIENAGVDRRRALGLLVKKEKIVLMATHDPLLALSGSRRLVIRNGGIAAELRTSAEERTVLRRLDAMDAQLTELRNRIRQGKRLSARP